jgi:hypothetical protein
MKTRRLISWISFFSFTVLGATGLIMYFTPTGRIANWADWRFLALSKEDWGAIHIMVSMLFLVTAVWHTFLNWKPLVNYIRNSSRKVSFVKPEFLVSLVITLVFCLGAYLHVPPFGSILTGLDNVKVYWEDEYGAPPWGHAELASIKTFSEKMGFDLEDSMAVLTAAGYREVSPKILMKDLAAANDTSPKHILELLQAKAKKAAQKTGTAGGEATEMSAPTGLGRLTLEQMAEKAGVEVDTAIRRLEKKLAIKAAPDLKIKEIATRTGEAPSAIWEVIQPGAGQ